MLATATPAMAQQVWIGSGSSADFNTATNWNPNTVPFNTETGVFQGTTAAPIVNLSSTAQVDGLQYDAGAQTYTVFTNSRTLQFNGAGIVNNSNVAQNFTINGSVIIFTNSSSADDATFNVDSSGGLFFGGSSSGGSANVNVDGFLEFWNSNGVNSIGSLSGSGTVRFNRDTDLSIGSLNTSTTFSGVIIESGAIGAITKVGTGTLTLTGSNTYSGGTTISGGTLQLGNGGATGSISGDVINNGTLTFNRSNIFQFDGGISGNGGVQQIGPGTTLLTGANTYAGGTTISNGTLQIGSVGAIGGGGILLSGGTLLGNLTDTLTNTVSLAFGTSSTIAATLGNTLTLGGNVFLSGNSDLHIGTAGVASAIVLTPNVTGGGDFDLFVDGGTLRMGNLSATTRVRTVFVTVANGAILDFADQPGSALRSLLGGGTVRTGLNSATNLFVQGGSFSGGIQGAGNLVLSCPGFCFPGTLTLSGTGLNTYSGTTGIANGYTLRGGAANAFNTNSATTVNAGGTLDIGGFNQTIASLAGAGTVTNSGGSIGDLTVGGNNASTIFGGLITNSGGNLGLIKAGTGTLMLTGANTYTGATLVNAGILSVNGSIASSGLTTVNAGGTLGGNGSVGNTTLAGGTLAPGNSIGTITVVGDLVFGAGSKYAVEVSPDTSDRTNVTGTATLSGGTVIVTYLPGTFVAKDYVILNAQGGLGGTKFAGLDAATLPGLTSSLVYDAANVHLVTTADGPDDPDFGALNANQRAVAAALLNYFNANGSLPAEFAGLDANGLTIVSGELAAGAITAGIDSADQFLGALDGQMETGGAGGAGQGAAAAYAEESKPAGYERFASLGMSAAHNADQVEQVFAKRWNVWGTFYGGSEVIDGDPVVGSHTTTADTWGLVGGVSMNTEDTLVGIGLGGGASHFSLSDGLGDGSANTFNAGIYGRQGFGNAYVSGALAYGFHDVETDRTVFGEVLSGDFNANSYSGRGEAGYRFDAPLVAISPYAAFQATAYHLPDYTETSSGAGTFALHYDAETTTATRVELGARLEHVMALSDGGLLTLTGRAAWAINGGTARNVGAAFQSLPGTAFTIDGAEPDANSALLDAGAEYAAPSGFFAAATFQSEFSGNVQMYAGKLKLGFKW